MIGLAMLRDEIKPDTDLDELALEMLASENYADTFAPGQRCTLQNAQVGSQWHILGHDCFVVPREPSRFVWTGD